MNYLLYDAEYNTLYEARSLGDNLYGLFDEYNNPVGWLDIERITLTYFNDKNIGEVCLIGEA